MESEVPMGPRGLCLLCKNILGLLEPVDPWFIPCSLKLLGSPMVEMVRPVLGGRQKGWSKNPRLEVSKS